MNRQRRLAREGSPPIPGPPPPQPPFGYDPRHHPMDEYDEFYPHHHPQQMLVPPHYQQPPAHMGDMYHHEYPPNRYIEPHQPAPYPPDYRDPSSHHLRLAAAHRAREPNHHMAPYSPNSGAPLPPPTPVMLPQQNSNPTTYKILCITNFNHKVGDAQMKETLVNEFSRFGDISVSVCHDNGDRLAYIYFRSYEEAREARHMMTRSILFDRPIEIEPIYDSRRASPIDPVLMPPAMSPPIQDAYYNDPGPPPPMMHRRAVPPPPPPPPHYHQGPMSRYQPPMPDDRYFMQQPNMAPHNPHSPYSSPPPHEHYRNYPPQPPHSNNHMHQPPDSPYHPYAGSASPFGPHGGPPPQPPQPMPHRKEHRSMNHEMHLRSPRHDPYNYPVDSNHRAYPHPPGYSNKRHHPDAVPEPSQHSDHRQPPMRYFSREFRREKLGIIDSPNNEPEEGRPSRVLFITNIRSDKSEDEIREIFQPFGTIDELEIRKVSPDNLSILIKFSSMDCAYKAKTATNDRHLLGNKCKIVYGKVTASRKLWIGGLGSTTTVTTLQNEFGRFGKIINLDYISGRPYAYVEYESSNQAQFATHHLKGTIIAEAERKLRIEYVDTPNSIDNSNKLSANKNSGSSHDDLLKSSGHSANESYTASTDTTGASPQQSINSQKRRNSFSSQNDGNESKRICQDDEETPASPDENNDSQINGNTNDTRLDSNIMQRNTRDCNNKIISSNAGISGVINFDENQEEPDPRYLIDAKKIKNIVDCCPINFSGQLVLRNFTFLSKMSMCSGRKATIEKYITKLDDHREPPILRITQRWRLHPQPKLEEVKKRMQTGNLGMFIITSKADLVHDQHQSPSLSTSSPACKTPQTPNNVKPQNGESKDAVDDKVNDTSAEQGNLSGAQSRPLKNLISYLEQKDAAGVVSLNLLDQSSASSNPKLLYTFPPGDFAMNLLRQKAPNLLPESDREEFLLGVIVGGAEGKM